MIQIKSLQFAYKRKKVFDDLDLNFQPGCIYGLLGKNGTGKSSLLRNIHGFIFPDKGNVTAIGHKPQRRQPEFLQDIFLIAEEFYLPNVSIAKYVQSNAPFYPKFDQAQFENYLQIFGVPMGNKLQQMSYGQKKKVYIAFGLACNTKIILMDEPSNGLDIMSKSQFRKVIAGAVNDQKCMIISTHQVRDLEALIDHIILIDEGKILFNHSLDQIQDKLSFSFSYGQNIPSGSIYHEASLTGYAYIKQNDAADSGKIDLELLYKAVMENQAGIKKAFE